jgi:NADH-quinone oxidoreductase subunit L
MSIFILIPLLPLFAAFSLTLGGRRWGEYGHRIGIPAIGLSFGLSIWAFLEVLRNGPISISLYRLFQAGSLVVDLSLYIDQLTVLLLLLVTGVSSVVHVYSSRYMIGDPRYNRFFAVIALFTFSMLMLVMSNNLLMLFACWEVMGLCSYLLISHWSQRKAAIQAATKAFLVNAIADVGLGFGIILTFSTFGTLDIQTILSQADSMQDRTMNLLGWIGLEFSVHTLTIIPLFLFLGAMGKSAQVPFHVWLPFAMEAPTPVSALIHAATMVNAGPFLLIRLSPLIVLSPMAMTVIAVIGAVTALFAAIVSLTQSDIKKILAYSTISQIGFMIMTCGIGAFVAAAFHLLAHGCLKAFLFLSTGNALQSVQAHGHPQSDIGHGQQSRQAWSLYVGALVLACIPPFVIFSGPYEYLWTVHHFASAKIGFWVIGLTTVFFTAMYLFRGILLLFQSGPSVRDSASGKSVVIQPQLFSPSHLLGLVVVGVALVSVLIVLWGWFVQFLAPALGQPVSLLNEQTTSEGISLWIMVPLVVAFGGWAFAYFLHIKPRPSFFAQSAWGKTLYVLFLNKLYFDEIYEVYVVQPTLRFSKWLWLTVDLGVIDRFITSIGAVSVSFSRWLWQVVDVKGIDRGVVGIGGHTVSFARWLWYVVDIKGIDRGVVGIGSHTASFARWLWHVVDVKGIDRGVVGIGGHTASFARWLWKFFDIQRIEENVEPLGREADATGHMLQRVEPRTLQHHLLGIIIWLVAAIGLFYWLV